jgi:hypothetical protein
LVLSPPLDPSLSHLVIGPQPVDVYHFFRLPFREHKFHQILSAGSMDACLASDGA